VIIEHCFHRSGGGAVWIGPVQVYASTVQGSLGWNRTSLNFHRTGSHSVWTGPGLHFRVKLILAEVGLGMG